MTSLIAVSADDVRNVFHLVSELREFVGDPIAWRAHMMLRLQRLTESRVLLDAETTPLVMGPASFYESSDLGYDDNERDISLTYFYAPDPQMPDPMWHGLARFSGSDYTLLRRSFVDDQTWYGSAFINEVRGRFGLDDLVVSSRAIPGFECTHMLAFFRPSRERPFSEREREMVALFHDEFAKLFVPRTAHGVHVQLTPALRQALEALLAGDSEKQAADRLRVSANALHDRVKRLHRLFGAHSRGELLAHARRLLVRERPMLEIERGVPEKVRWYRIEEHV